jgi:hypothetical protein
MGIHPILSLERKNPGGFKKKIRAGKTKGDGSFMLGGHGLLSPLKIEKIISLRS